MKSASLAYLPDVGLKFCLYNVTYMWNLKQDTDELIYKTKNRFTDIGYKLMVTKGEEMGKG